MPLRYWTLIIVGAFLVSFVVWDSIMAGVDGRATLSWITAQWAFKHTIGVFVLGMILGIILGHLLWWQNPLGVP